MSTPEFTPQGMAKRASCRECCDALEWGGGDQYRCTVEGCERFHVVVNEYGHTPEEEDNYDGASDQYHWTDAWPKGTNLTDKGDGQPYIWARNE